MVLAIPIVNLWIKLIKILFLLTTEGAGNPVQSHQPNEDTVIVKNSDGRYVQMPRSLLKKLINSGQLKQSNSNVTANNSVVPSTPTPPQQVAISAPAHEPLGPRITSNDVLNLLPTVPVRQEHLQHEWINVQKIMIITFQFYYIWCISLLYVMSIFS